jgi:hypothetical protein
MEIKIRFNRTAYRDAVVLEDFVMSGQGYLGRVSNASKYELSKIVNHHPMVFIPFTSIEFVEYVDDEESFKET